MNLDIAFKVSSMKIKINYLLTFLIAIFVAACSSSQTYNKQPVYVAPLPVLNPGCEVISQETYNLLLRMNLIEKRYVIFSKENGQKEPTTPRYLRKIEYENLQTQAGWGLKIYFDGTQINLADVLFEETPGKFRNLSSALNCSLVPTKYGVYHIYERIRSKK